MPLVSNDQLSNTNELSQRFTQLDRFSGGMSTVLMCHDHVSGQVVALKTLASDMAGKRSAWIGFLEEAKIWISIGQHPNIVRALEVVRLGDARIPHLVLEWIFGPEGQRNSTLRAKLRRGRAWPLGRSLRVALDVSNAMIFACDRVPGLVHRDLKPNNILVDALGQSRVTDFGVAASLDNAALRQLMKNPRHRDDPLNIGGVGTPRYRAPEQWEAGAAVDCRADIYGLGCVLYQLLCGQPSVTASDLDEVERAHRESRLAPFPRSFPTELVEFLGRSMNRDPDNRQTSWWQYRDELLALWRNHVPFPPPDDASAEDTVRQTAWQELGLAKTYLDIGKPAVARELVGRAVTASRIHDPGNLAVAAGLQLALLDCQHGDRQSGMIALAHWRNEADRRKLPRLGTLALVTLAGQHAGSGEVELAMQLLDELTEAHTRSLDSDIVFMSVHTRGVIAAKQKEYSLALSCFQRASDLAVEMGCLRSLSQAQNSVGAALLDSGAPDKASVVLRKALDHATSLHHSPLIIDLLTNLGNACQALGDSATAEQCLHNRYHIARDLGDPTRLVGACVDIGRFQLGANQTSDAVDYFQEALSWATGETDPNTVFNANVGLGTALLARGGDGDISVAKTALDSARSLLQEDDARAALIDEAFSIVNPSNEMARNG